MYCVIYVHVSKELIDIISMISYYVTKINLHVTVVCMVYMYVHQT